MPTTKEPTTELGAAIRHVRKKVLHLSQAQLGEKLNAKGNSLSRWETGASKPHISMLSALAHLAAKNRDEERRYYSDWIVMLGNPRPDLRSGPASGGEPPAPPVTVHGTIEGEVARTIVDAEPDRERRWMMVEALRAMMQQSPASAAETEQDPHPGE